MSDWKNVPGAGGGNRGGRGGGQHGGGGGGGGGRGQHGGNRGGGDQARGGRGGGNDRGGGGYRGGGGDQGSYRGRGGGSDRGGGGDQGSYRGRGGGSDRGGGGDQGSYRGRGGGSDRGGGGRGGGGDGGYGGSSYGRGDFRGNRGGDRGSRGGYSRGPRGKPPTFEKTQIPQISSQDFARLDKEYGKGWTNFSANKDDVKLQTYKGPPGKDCEQKITLSVNHFPLSNFKFPARIYHYEVTMERIKTPKTGEDKDGKPAPAVEQGQQKGKGKKGKGPPTKPGPGQPSAGGAAAGQPPRKLPKPLPQLILTVLLERIRREMKFYGIVSDLSNNIYSTKELEGKIALEQIVNMNETESVILQENDNGLIKVKIERSELQLDTSAMSQYFQNNQSWKGMEMDIGTKTTVEQAYNAIVKSMPNFLFLSLGRSNLIRWPEGEVDKLGSGIVNWKGISANISMGWKPYLNVDIANCALLEDKKVLKALEDEFRCDVGNINLWHKEHWRFETARAMLKNVKIFYNLPKGKCLGGSVSDVLDTSVRDTTFPLQNTTISVFDYYQRQYGIKVNPDGPCLLLNKKNQVPAELCTIKKGQSYNKRLNEEQTRNMLTIAKKDPKTLKYEIERSIQEMRLAENEVMKAWGINVAKEMLTLPNTRVLAPPKLRYGAGTKENEGKGSAVITPVEGQWEIWSSNFQFFEPKDVENWGILVAGDCRVNDDAVWKFCDLLTSNGASKGVHFLKDPIFKKENRMRDYDAKRNVETLKKIFDTDFRGCNLVVVIIPKKNSSIYSHVKQAAELQSGSGVLTQCVVGQNVFKGQAATVQNILLKINSKLGGVNQVIVAPPDKKVIDLLRCPMLVIGADVTHPPPGSKKWVGKVEVETPSFAAVTGSVDRTGMPFMMDIKAQKKAGKGAAEVIQHLEEIIEKMLLKFEQVTRNHLTPNGIRPRKIVYFRDGVGEGQFPEVLHTEMHAIRRACSKFKDYNGGNYEPKITFVTVQKRHKTRFFYHQSQGQMMNPPPGTIVDTEIVHQTETDFYLCSHKGMMGTSRPTRYHVLWDDSNWTADDIQTLTYYLCYMYVRCNKSVKIPAPTYYAHWAAARAKALSEGQDHLFGDLDRLNQVMKRHEALSAFPMHFV